ncbi:MAG: 50S ribosomal protein L23 [Patescibacteria group bacterium]
MKGTTTQAYRVLVKPLVTEKVTFLNALNKYVFVINPKMNKVEVKKAIRTIYKVNPVAVNISNFSGKYVRYGQVEGKTKNWKKAIVTLKPGDKIEVYEGV